MACFRVNIIAACPPRWPRSFICASPHCKAEAGARALLYIMVERGGTGTTSECGFEQFKAPNKGDCEYMPVLYVTLQFTRSSRSKMGSGLWSCYVFYN